METFIRNVAPCKFTEKEINVLLSVLLSVPSVLLWLLLNFSEQLFEKHLKRAAWLSTKLRISSCRFIYLGVDTQSGAYSLGNSFFRVWVIYAIYLWWWYLPKNSSISSIRKIGDKGLNFSTNLKPLSSESQ